MAQSRVRVCDVQYNQLHVSLLHHSYDVLGAVIHLFICYSKVCVGISTPMRGVSALTKFVKNNNRRVVEDSLANAIDLGAGTFLQLSYLAVLQDDCGTLVTSYSQKA